MSLSRRLHKAVRALDCIAEHSINISIGVTGGRLPEQPIGELLKEADDALYRAKEGGRNRTVYCDNDRYNQSDMLVDVA